MELNDLVLLGMFAVVLQIVFSIIVVVVLNFVKEYRVAKLERVVEGLQKAEYQRVGQDAREENKARTAEAMAQLAAIMQNPEITDKKDAVMKLAAQYPDVAIKMAKKFGLSI